MKFKVSPKDAAIFSGFCIVLLYFCAIAVLNVLALINGDGFKGLNPIEAFTGTYLPVTLFVFFAVLIAIFFSVSSTIFEHQKGFGIGLSFGKSDEGGYSRWLTEKEMKKAYKIYRVGVKDTTAEVGGIVFINDGKNMWVDDSENHTLVIGVTGSGKTTAVVDPLIYSLCKHGESMIFTDPKGEIYKNHAELMKSLGYKIVVLNFREPTLGNAWNPLTLPYRLYKAGNVDKAIELVDDVALNILADPKAQDPFWSNSASDYFSGCVLGLFEDAKEEEVNINTISYMTTVGEEKFGAGSNYIKEYFTLKGESSSPYTFASNTINSPTETKGSILAVFRQKIRLFASREQLSEMLSHSDFEMRDIGKQKTAVFMIIHDEKTTYHALATIFIKQCYETLIDVAQESGGKLPIRTNFILDEFANMPPLKDVTTMVTAARSRQIRFTFIIQNFAQLNEVYGKEDAETIRSNCGNLIYLLTTELSALEEISKMCGEVKSKKDDKTASQPLVTISDLQKMKMNEVIILRNRYHPFKTQLVQGFNVDWGDKDFGKAEFVPREKKEIQLFDIKEHVKLRKKSKMMDGFDPKKPGLPDFNPFGGMSGDRPMPKIPTFEEFMAARNAGKDPFASKPKSPLPKPAGGPNFDVDDLVKRIDAKIAELEAQEKEEEEKKKKETNATPSIFPPLPEKVELEKKETEESSLTINKEAAIDRNNVVETNPFANITPIINENKLPKKDFIEGIETIETSPIKAPIIEEKKEPVREETSKIETFSDLLNLKSKEEVSVEEPVKEEPIVPPVESKEESPVVEKEYMAAEPVIENKPKEEVTPEKKVENKSDVSDDAYFDDFFDLDD